jgi:hypothetical protein
MISLTFRQCEKRPEVKYIQTQILRRLKFTSDAAISLHYLTVKSFSNATREPLLPKLRAGRLLKSLQQEVSSRYGGVGSTGTAYYGVLKTLLRGCSNNQLGKVQIHIQRKFAMTGTKSNAVTKCSEATSVVKG